MKQSRNQIFFLFSYTLSLEDFIGVDDTFVRLKALVVGLIQSTAIELRMLRIENVKKRLLDTYNMSVIDMPNVAGAVKEKMRSPKKPFIILDFFKSY